jgi:hypothetical protein
MKGLSLKISLVFSKQIFFKYWAADLETEVNGFFHWTSLKNLYVTQCDQPSRSPSLIWTLRLGPIC